MLRHGVAARSSLTPVGTQMVGYNLQKEPAIHQFFSEAFQRAPAFKDDRDMYDKSLQLEPRNAKREDIK